MLHATIDKHGIPLQDIDLVLQINPPKGLKMISNVPKK